MAKGGGFEVGDWVVIAALGVAAFFTYKAVIGPVSRVTNEAADIAELPYQIFDYGDWIEKYL